MNIKFDKIQPKTKHLRDLKVGDGFEYDNDIYICLEYSNDIFRKAFNLTRNTLESFEYNEIVYPVTINATVEYERAD